MAAYYDGYLKGSQCYKNLTDAQEKLESFKTLFQDFKDTFDTNVSGNVIDEYKDRIVILESKVDLYIQNIKKLIKALESNAKKGDNVLNNWKSKVGQDYEPSSCISNTLKDDIRTTDTLYKKVLSVDIDGNNKIKITVKVYVNRVKKNTSTNTIESKENINKPSEYYTVDFNGNVSKSG